MKPKLYLAKMGTNGFMYDDQTKASVEADLRKKAQRTGEAIIWNDKSREFYEATAITDTTNTGADIYIWHRDGCKVKCRFEKVVVSPEGAMTRTFIKFCWKHYDDV